MRLNAGRAFASGQGWGSRLGCEHGQNLRHRSHALDVVNRESHAQRVFQRRYKADMPEAIPALQRVTAEIVSQLQSVIVEDVAEDVLQVGSGVGAHGFGKGKVWGAEAIVDVKPAIRATHHHCTGAATETVEIVHFLRSRDSSRPHDVAMSCAARHCEPNSPSKMSSAVLKQPDRNIENPAMSEANRSDPYDHSSHPSFSAYYTEQSALPRTRDRFARVRDKALRLVAQQGDATAPLMVLDIGCGAGTQAWLWSELGHRVHGIDVNGELIDVAQARARADGLDVSFEVGTATSLPFPDHVMDVCLMPELLEHVDDWQSCIREAVRVLKPGGLLYLSSTNALCPMQSEFNLPLYSWYPAPLKRWVERLSVTSRPDLANFARYPAVHWFTFAELRRFLAPLGMRALGRMDVYDTAGRSAQVRGAVWAIRHSRLLDLAVQVVMEGTIIFAIKVRQ